MARLYLDRESGLDRRKLVGVFGKSPA
jgi:hypothetical protein